MGYEKGPEQKPDSLGTENEDWEDRDEPDMRLEHMVETITRSVGSLCVEITDQARNGRFAGTVASFPVLSDKERAELPQKTQERPWLDTMDKVRQILKKGLYELYDIPDDYRL